MKIDKDVKLKVDLPDGEYLLHYGWIKSGRGKIDDIPTWTESVTVKDGIIDEDSLVKGAEVYRVKSGLLDDTFIEEVYARDGIIEYMTGS